MKAEFKNLIWVQIAIILGSLAAISAIAYQVLS
jgi:hypothetical protein